MPPVPGFDGPATVVGALIFGFGVPANLRQVNNDCKHQKLILLENSICTADQLQQFNVLAYSILRHVAHQFKVNFI